MIIKTSLLNDNKNDKKTDKSFERTSIGLSGKHHNDISNKCSSTTHVCRWNNQNSISTKYTIGER